MISHYEAAVGHLLSLVPSTAPEIPVVKIKSAKGTILPLLLEMTDCFGFKKKKQSLVTEHPHGLDPKSYTPFSPGGPWGSSKEPQPQLLLPPLLPSLTQHLLLAGGQSGQGLMAERMVSTFGSLHYLRSKCLAIHSILGYMQIISKST